MVRSGTRSQPHAYLRIASSPPWRLARRYRLLPHSDMTYHAVGDGSQKKADAKEDGSEPRTVDLGVCGHGRSREGRED